MRDFSQTLATLMCGFIMEQDLIKEITAENRAKQPQPGQSCKFFCFFYDWCKLVSFYGSSLRPEVSGSDFAALFLPIIKAISKVL